MPEEIKEEAKAPQSLDEVIEGLKGFGVQENEEILTFVAGDRQIRMRITNLPTEQEIQSLVACEEFKGYAWVQRIRVEILSRSISWINGVSLRDLTGKARIVVDPTDGQRKDIRAVLRNVLLGWGQELITTLWKIAMVHSDRIEKRYQSEFPDSTIMTDVERRFMETVMHELEESSRAVIKDTVDEVMKETVNSEFTPEGE